jgi:hypothetical protein
MADYVYIKGEGKSTWKIIPNTELDIAEAVKQGARFNTILSVDKDIDALNRLGSTDKVQYKGPMYFDLDSKHDLDAAIADLKRLLIALYFDYGMNLNDVRVWASGSKGFHVLIPAKVFSKNRANATLAYTYKNVALAFDLVTLDFGTYSAGKGRMWRIENQCRENGKYKVRLTIPEVFSLTLEKLEEVCSAPRTPTFMPDNVEYTPQLAALFEASKFKPKKITAIADAKLQALSDDPVCIKKLLALEDLNPDKNFNMIVMTLAGYFTGRGIDIDTYISRCTNVIEEGVSSVYTLSTERERHMRAIYSYYAAKPDYKFVCSFANKRVQNLKCAICELQNSAESGVKELGIEEMGCCYYKTTIDGGLQQISTFKITPLKEVSILDNGKIEFCLNAELISSCGHSAKVVFQQQDWLSKSAFLKTLPNPRYSFWGGDDTVQKIANKLIQLNIPHQKGVRVEGMHRYENAWHFVTRAGSISKHGKSMDELLLADETISNSNLLNVEPATKAELDLFSPLLWSFNDFSVAVPILGWYVSCFFKARLFAHTEQFPLLFAFGEHGSGKTLTTILLRRMFAVPDNVTLRNVADQTKFTMTKATSERNCVPVSLDEYKGTQFASWQRKNIASLIRAAYNNETAERGKADQTVRVYRYQAPIAFTGEQTITEGAVKDRIIEVQMTRALSQPFERKYQALKELPLDKLGRSILELALSISEKELITIFENKFKSLQNSITDRPRLNLAIILTGLELLAQVLDEGNMEHKLRIITENWLTKRLQQQATNALEDQKTDIDRIFEIFALMTQGERLTLRLEEHFMVQGNKLIINMRLAHANFIKFVKEYDIQDVEPLQFNTFQKLVIRESYFIAKDAIHTLGYNNRCCFEFDISKMQARGLNLMGLTDAVLNHPPEVEM